MVNFRTNLYCPFIILLILPINFIKIHGLIRVTSNKRGNEFLTTESPNKEPPNIELVKEKYTSEKENEDFDYNDDYKDILFVFPNSTHDHFNITEKINNTDVSDFETYEDPELTEVFRAVMQKERNLNATTVNTTTIESTTANITTTLNYTTPLPRDIYYDEKDADYYLRNYPKKDYIATVTVPTVIVISVILAILYALLHLPKCCFGLFYEPSYQTYYQKNAALAAKEELQEELLDEE